MAPEKSDKFRCYLREGKQTCIHHEVFVFTHTFSLQLLIILSFYLDALWKISCKNNII